MSDSEEFLSADEDSEVCHLKINNLTKTKKKKSPELQTNNLPKPIDALLTKGPNILDQAHIQTNSLPKTGFQDKLKKDETKTSNQLQNNVSLDSDHGFFGFMSNVKKLSFDVTKGFNTLLETVETTMSIPSPELLAATDPNSTKDSEVSLFKTMNLMINHGKTTFGGFKKMTLDALDNSNIPLQDSIITLIDPATKAPTLSDMLKEAAIHDNDQIHDNYILTIFDFLDANTDYVQYQALEMLSKQCLQRFKEIKNIKNMEENMLPNFSTIEGAETTFKSLESLHSLIIRDEDSNIKAPDIDKLNEALKLWSSQTTGQFSDKEIMNNATLNDQYKLTLTQLSNVLAALFEYVHKTAQAILLSNGTVSQTVPNHVSPALDEDSLDNNNYLIVKASAVASLITFVQNRIHEFLDNTKEKINILSTTKESKRQIDLLDSFVKKLEIEFDHGVEMVGYLKDLIKPIFMLKSAEIIA